MQIKSLVRASSIVILTGAFFPMAARSAALLRRDDLAATATLAPQAATTGVPVGIVSAAAVPEIPEPQISEPGSSSADESPDGSDALAAQTLDPSEDDDYHPASAEDDSAEPAEEEDADAAPADYHPDDVEEDDGAYPAYAPDDGEEEVSPASTDDQDASPASAEDEDELAPSSEAPEDDVDAAGVPKTFVPQQQQRHHRRRRIRYSARARLSQRRLGILRDRLSIRGKKGAKKMYGMTYYHKKTSYPVGPLGYPAPAAVAASTAPSVVGSVAYYGTGGPVTTAGAAPGTTVVGGTPSVLYPPIAPAEDVTYKKVRAFRKTGAAARKLAERIRLLRLRKALRAHRKLKIRL
ncbi:hypothetical protein HDU96_000877 [Phlyctochytrium bullatum]|nr:hypothetical protein HDU96_000877 [Phlyctochytrium bullatum]